MKKLSICTAFLFAILTGAFAQSSAENNAMLVTRIDASHFSIKNKQSCTTAFWVKMAGRTDYDTLSAAAKGDSTIIFTDPTGCGNIMVKPRWSCTAESCGEVAINTCSVLPINVRFKALPADSKGRIYVELKFASEPTGKTFKAKVKMTDGTFKIVNIPLVTKKGDTYYYYVETK